MHEPGPGDSQPPAAGVVPALTPRRRPIAVSYLGFRVTEDGREYALRAECDSQPRHFVMLIPHAVFAAHQARFQDAPGLCFAKLERELAADPEFAPDARLILSNEELLESRRAREAPPVLRKRRAPGSGAGSRR